MGQLNKQDQFWRVNISLATVKGLIQTYALRYQRQLDTISLLAVSKGQAFENLLPLWEAGQHVFGESYLQEALPKIQAAHQLSLHRPDLTPIEWHFIGPIQSNKTKKIAEQFAWVHSVASEKIAKRLHEQRPAHLPPLNICIEVNISHEATKSGVTEAEISPLVDYCLQLPRLCLRGLMAIPAYQQPLTSQRLTYKKLYERWYLVKKHLGLPAALSWDTLSMGMSEDMEAAIAEGATIIRIGRAIFATS